MAASPPPPPHEETAPTTSSENPPELAPPLALNSENQATDSKELTPLPPEPSVQIITIPSYSRWFSFHKIHETERRLLPEFFDSRTPPSKNPRVYKYYRDSIVRRFRENPLRKLTYTEVRRTLVGDVGSIRRVFDFLEGWGLINYTRATALKLKGEEKESKLGVGTPSPAAAVDSHLEKKESAKKVCGGCKTVCSQVCFACDKVDLILCSRCFVRGNYRVGLNSGDFKRVAINEEAKTDWTEKETLHLLEAVLQYGDDWKKVAEHVGSKEEKECVSRFIKLPFGEQFLGPPDIDEVDKYYQIKDQTDSGTGVENSSVSSPAKRRCLTPLADASNPIMGQAAFLSAVVGSEVAEAAAQAAVAALSEVGLTDGHNESRENFESLAKETDHQEAVAANGHTEARVLEQAGLDAWALLEKEEQDVERSISDIIEVQMKEIQEKIVHFEGLDMQMEKEWLQLQHMKDLLFADQLTILQHRAPLRFGESGEKDKVKSTDAVT
ncbi:SWI/SNF complex subunit SWI3B [Magnolia sinica]|uniref:SWI/SNF complex subunit SWI3B n=1 Tax=Magnolia sinica TaxID=86752 RepID=UPI0026589256|nr:SWI/SNF complex subunit SWI3B [Magnolia sinica]